MSRSFIVALSLFAVPAFSPAVPRPADSKPDNPFGKLDRDEMTPVERDVLPDIAVATATVDKGTVVSISLSSDGKLAAGTDKGEVVIWDLTGAAPKAFTTLQPPNAIGTIDRVAFSPDGRMIAAVNAGNLYVWTITADGAKPFDSKQVGRVEGIAWSPDGKVIVAGANLGYALSVHDKGVDKLPVEFKGAQGNYTFSADGSFFSSIFFTPERNGGRYGSQVAFWKLGKGKPVEWAMVDQTQTIKATALSPDAKLLATGSLDNTVRIWDVGGKKVAEKAKMQSPTWMRHLAFSADGEQVFGYSAQADILLYDVAKGEQVKAWQFKPRQNTEFATGAMYNLIGPASTTPDGKYSAFGNHTAKVVVLRLPTKPLEKK